MMMSPGSSSGISFSMKSSTGWPAFTSSITRRGRFNAATSSSRECVPMMVMPLAGPSTNASTTEVVRL